MRLIVVVGVHAVAIALLLKTSPTARGSDQEVVRMEVRTLTATASATPLQVDEPSALSLDTPLIDAAEPKEHMRLESPSIEKTMLTTTSESAWSLTGSPELEIRDPSDEYVEIDLIRPQETPKAKVKQKSVSPPAAKHAPVAAATSQTTQVKKNTDVLSLGGATQDVQPFVGVRFDADYLHNPPPAYPTTSRRLKEQGVVLIFVHVNERGDPVSVQLKQSSGHERLDQAAIDAVHKWRFVPAKRGQTPIAASVVVPIHFKR
jgi:protein TonB